MLHAMKSRGIERYPAQRWCDRKNNGKLAYSGSWMLPSYRLFYSICGYNGTNVNSLNDALRTIGGTTIIDDHYWTCNEDVDGYITIGGQNHDYDQANRALVVTPYNQTWANKDHMLKKLKSRVRAIKIIYYNN